MIGRPPIGARSSSSKGSIAERDRRIEELMPATHLLREKGAELKEWDKKYARAVQEHKTAMTKLQEQCVAQEQLREQLLLNEQQLRERDEQIAGLHRQLQDLQAERHNLLHEVQSIPGKDEQLDRLNKRLRELESAHRAKRRSSNCRASPVKPEWSWIECSSQTIKSR